MTPTSATLDSATSSAWVVRCERVCAWNDVRKNGDCKNGGPSNKVVVDDSACNSGFSCARIQTLGKFCCEKLCVCNDDLGVTEMIDQQCSTSMQVGCCDQNPIPDACGKP